MRERMIRRMLPAEMSGFLEILLYEPPVLKPKRFVWTLSLRTDKQRDGGMVAVHHMKMVDSC
jgi:hypothetical protein